MQYPFNGKIPDVHDSVYIAPGSKLIGEISIGKESSVWFNCVLRADNDAIRIGERVNIQDGTICHVDADVPLTVADEVTVGHRAILHGCTVGKGALIGMGAIVMNRAEIGEYSLVAAGALVTEGKKLPPRSLIIGSPAKAVRELTGQEIEGLKRSAWHYAENGRSYKEQRIAD